VKRSATVLLSGGAGFVLRAGGATAGAAIVGPAGSRTARTPWSRPGEPARTRIPVPQPAVSTSDRGDRSADLHGSFPAAAGQCARAAACPPREARNPLRAQTRGQPITIVARARKTCHGPAPTSHGGPRPSRAGGEVTRTTTRSITARASHTPARPESPATRQAARTQPDGRGPRPGAVPLSRALVTAAANNRLAAVAREELSRHEAWLS
jgi:hypothetical protein